MARAFGAKRASIAVAARNLMTWTPFQGTDPENVAIYPYSGNTNSFKQNELPNLMQLMTKINVTF
jgi:hypothetical protein